MALYERRRPGMRAPCSIEGCDRPSHGQGLCGSHHSNLLRRGDPIARSPWLNLPAGTKWCSGECKAGLPVDQFSPGNTACRKCIAAKQRARRKVKPARIPTVKPVVTCARCGVVFVGDRKNRRYCSKPCMVSGTNASPRYRARKARATVEMFDKTEVFIRDNWTCGLCGLPIDSSLAWPHLLSVSIDHKVPLSRGGEHSRANCQAAHLSCNARKGAREGAVA